MMKMLVVGDFQGVFPAKLKNKIKKENFELVVGVGDYGGIMDWKPFIFDIFKRLKRGDERISPEDFYGKKKFKAILKKDYKMGKMVLTELNKIGKPVVLIFGNTDDEWYSHPLYKRQKAKKKALNYLKKLKNIKVITYGKTTHNDFDFIGAGGYMDIEAYYKKKTFKAKSERDNIKRKIKINRKMRGRFFKLLRKAHISKREKIFVYHFPPYGVFDIIKDKKNPMDGESAGIKYFSEAVKKYKPSLVLCGHMHEYRGIKKIYGVPVINSGDAGEGKAAIVEVLNGKTKVKFIN